MLDDLHWADELSLLLLRHLLRADDEMRLVVLGTYRDTEPTRSPLLAEALTGLARRPDVTRLELGPLGEPDVAAILADANQERSEEHTSELQSPSVISYAVFCRAKAVTVATSRSEERRVGKECPVLCRSRWSPYH